MTNAVDETHEAARELFREAVLDAMDATADKLFSSCRTKGRNPGGSDDDLRTLLPAIDAQFERLAVRYAAAFLDG